jgi:hypothetical protein
MSAAEARGPVSRDPLVVNTQDGSCWLRRAVTRDGHGLYALAGVVAGAPDEVLATIPELAADHKLASMAFALPMPVGSGRQVPELERLRSEVAALREERHSTNESVDDAAKALRADRDRIDGLESTNAALRARLAVLEAQRAALAERLRAGQTWRRGRLAGEDLVAPSELRSIFGIPLAAPLNGEAEADGITKRIAPMQALLAGQRAAVEDPHESPLHHTYRVPRDLPAPDGAQ